ncbi:MULTISPECIES: tetratricopeptide repeat-containing sulfotransferase family protein [unclassified Novosphingobium]|uniref:tetratricopeptide repeat-containing sulfotransferase family protein n=1 Tax=unclassified Novosphingobium TaxID=2644732 RepID=UPI0025DBB7AD|nr:MULTISPECIES: tetratricopeptide repeat-containing sulfotransferase family protein [unclassified Novosphingobium]HQV02058.1 sulfotransferase [Novosphingobium sp.]
MNKLTNQSWLSRLGQYPPRLIEAALAMNANDIPRAEFLLRGLLKDDPFEVAAIRMLAEVAGRIGRYRDSENLLRRALELSPGFTAARANLALVLYRQNRATDAIAELDQVLAEEPENPGHANLKAAAFGRIGDFEEAIVLYEQVLAKTPNQPRVWMSFGHMLKTVGRLDEGIAAYRKAIDLMPSLGEVWWSLANLKTVKFSDADLAAMEAALAGTDLAKEDRFHLDFALGKAYEDRAEPAAAFSHYAAANALRRTDLDYDADETERLVDQIIEVCTPDLFASAAGQGSDASDPIFVLGMPRAGSTLVEQILSSHSLIEGTTELPDIPALARRAADYPLNLPRLTGEQLVRQGEEFLRRSRIQRKSERPFFIDKLPNNWMHVAYIRLILPHAKIIDARRHPLGCCFSNFKQHFAKGQAFSYSLSDMGRYYRDYVRLMDHFERVQPGKVHRVIYERMVDDTETEVRKLLDFCGVEFEEACLAFHKTERAVRTPSSEQVRQPIFRDGTEAWKPFAAQLDPLREALGPVLDCYPDAPKTW